MTGSLNKIAIRRPADTAREACESRARRDGSSVDGQVITGSGGSLALGLRRRGVRRRWL